MKQPNEHAGEGPTLIEAKTYRWKGHSKSDIRKYRTRKEEERWQANDPIKRFEKVLITERVLTEKDAEQIKEEAYQSIEDAVKFAERSPMPSMEELEKDVYA